MSKNLFWKVNVTWQWEYEYLARPGGDAELPEHIPSTSPSPFDLWLWSLVWGNTVFQTTLRERLPHWATTVTPWTPHLLYPTAFRALSHPTELSLLPSQRRGLHLFWHYYYFQGCVYQLQTSGHDARGQRATAAEHPAAQPGPHVTCVISAGYHSPTNRQEQNC